MKQGQTDVISFEELIDHLAGKPMPPPNNIKVEFDKKFFKNLDKLPLKAKKKENKLTQKDINNWHYEFIKDHENRLNKIEKEIKELKDKVKILEIK